METILYTDGAQVKIRSGGPVVVIGEKINPTGRKKLAAALEAGNFDYLVELATAQIAAGADVLDINVGVPGIDDVALLPEVVKLVASAVKAPICIDTPNVAALAAALPAAPGKPLVNSVNGEEKSLLAILPLVKDRGAAVIGLAMDDNGIPATAEARLAVTARIIERDEDRHPDRGHHHRPACTNRRRRPSCRIGHVENDSTGPPGIWCQHQPGRQQRVVRAARPAHPQPGVPGAGHRLRRHLHDY